MKKAVLLVVIGLLAAVAFLAIMSLCLAVPDILAWIAGYIGELMTYGLFISGAFLFFAWCINHAK